MSAPSKTDKPQDSNRGLKLVVLSLGLLLIGGTLLLFVLVFKKITSKPVEPTNAHIPREYRQCGEHKMMLQAGEVIETIDFDGVVARLVIELPDGGKAIRAVQICSGETLSNLVVRHKP